jgi:hypothetical protein
VESISTWWPPDTGVTEAILSTLVPIVTEVVSLYVHVLPTAIGNGTELVVRTPVDPFELVPADVELLLLIVFDEVELPADPELPVLQPVRTRPPRTANPTPARAE